MWRNAYVSLTAMQALVADLLGSFVHRGNDTIDEGVNDAIARLGTFCCVDRAYVFKLHKNGLFDNTHEWCADGIAPAIDDLQNMPQDAVAAWIGPLREGRAVYVPDVAALPHDRSDERDLLSGQGIKSVLVVPLLSEGELQGCVGFDAVRACRWFTDGEVSLLRSVCDVIGSALVRRTAAREVAKAEARLSAITRHSSSLVVVLGNEGHVLWASERVAEVLGRDPRTEPWWNNIDLATRKAVVDVVEASTRPALSLAGGPAIVPVVWDLPDHVLLTSTGPRWMTARITDLREEEAVKGLVLNAHDISDRRASEDALAHQATHDLLTGLPNRALLVDRIRAAGVQAWRSKRYVGVIFFDIDHFKLVNDGHSHIMGDRLLVAVADRLRRAVGPDHTVARFGGDEFVVVAGMTQTPDVLNELAGKLLRSFDNPIRIDDREFHISASVGTALYRGPTVDPDLLIQQADTAMYDAKSAGRARVVAFDQRLRAVVERRALIAERLHLALETGRVRPAFQPIVELATRSIVGYEALARWTDDVLGEVAPSEFIAAAEDLGTIGELGAVILESALDQAARPGCDWRLSVNLSQLQLEETELAESIGAALARSGVSPERLCLEITESAIAKDPARAIVVLEELRALGIRLSIDDFGTGYSSLSVLGTLPVDQLKIDRSFIKKLTSSHGDQQLVRAVIGLAKDFGLRITAEGIETQEQADFLRGLGCDNGQGYHFGRPGFFS